MPIINASAGIADSVAKGVAQGTENFVEQSRLNTQQDQRQQQLDIARRQVESREAEYALRKDERGRMMGQRENQIAQDMQKVRRKGATSVGAAAVEGAMGSGVDPMNPMFWGYAGKKIAQETARMGQEIADFEAIVSSLPDSGRRELLGETMGRMQESIAQKQDKLRRYGATGQINEWLSQHPEDGEAFVPIMQGVREGKISPDSAMSQLMERQDEVATRTVQIQAAQSMRQSFGTLVQGMTAAGVSVNSSMAQAAIEGAALRIEMGADPDAVAGPLLTDLFGDKVIQSAARASDQGNAAKERARAAKAARDEVRGGDATPPPGYPTKDWVALNPQEQIDALTLFHMGEDAVPKSKPDAKAEAIAEIKRVAAEHPDWSRAQVAEHMRNRGKEENSFFPPRGNPPQPMMGDVEPEPEQSGPKTYSTNHRSR